MSNTLVKRLQKPNSSNTPMTCRKVTSIGKNQWNDDFSGLPDLRHSLRSPPSQKFWRPRLAGSEMSTRLSTLEKPWPLVEKPWPLVEFSWRESILRATYPLRLQFSLTWRKIPELEVQLAGKIIGHYNGGFVSATVFWGVTPTQTLDLFDHIEKATTGSRNVNSSEGLKYGAWV